jgi:hypothetical protein
MYRLLQQGVFAFFLRHPTSFARHLSPPSPPPPSLELNIFKVPTGTRFAGFFYIN